LDDLADHDLIAEEDRVASRWTVSGTHRGELAGAAPTGRKLAISGLSIYRIAGGKLAEGWVQDDTMQQLGAAAAPQQAPAGTA
jgi:predicted ester cyclase